MLKNKSKTIQSIFIDIDETTNYHIGLQKFIDNIEFSEMTEANVRHKFKTIMKVLNKQNTMIMKLLVLNLTYIYGPNFDLDIATLLNKMGRGEEALKTMFQNKLKGR